MGEYRSPEIVPLSEDKRIKRINPFYVFIAIWFFFLILYGFISLIRFFWI